MRTRKFLAALGAGVLAALVIGTPAQADARVKPSATFDNGCKTNQVTAAVSTAGDEAVDFQIVIAGVTAPAATGSVTKATSPKTVTIPSAGKALTLQWKQGTTFVDAQPPSTPWTLPGKCKPTFEVVNPTCENQALRVIVRNPDIDGVEPLKVGSRTTEMTTTIAKGAQVTFTAFADFTIYVKGKLFPDTIHTYYKYEAKTGCTTPAPTITTTEVVVQPGAGGAAKGGAGGDETLPVTGANMPVVIGTGVVLLVVGTLGFVAARRRRVRFTA
jgi:LPXTG-motif cell wall-anchored protein